MTDPDVPLLADLDAGLLAPARADEVRRAAQADPRSAAVLHALTATRVDLAAVPAPVAPPDLVAGWMAALGTTGVDPVRPEDPADDDARGQDPGTVAALAGPVAQDPVAGTTDSPDPPVPDPSRVRTERAVRGHPTVRRSGWVLAAAAAALVVGVLALRPTGPPDLTRVELAGFARSTVGTTDLGALADAARRHGCLAAAGHPGAMVLGGRQVRLDGTPGVLLVLSTGELGRFRVIVVTPGCAVLADDVVGS